MKRAARPDSWNGKQISVFVSLVSRVCVLKQNSVLGMRAHVMERVIFI